MAVSERLAGGLRAGAGAFAANVDVLRVALAVAVMHAVVRVAVDNRVVAGAFADLHRGVLLDKVIAAGSIAVSRVLAADVDIRQTAAFIFIVRAVFSGTKYIGHKFKKPFFSYFYENQAFEGSIYDSILSENRKN